MRHISLALICLCLASSALAFEWSYCGGKQAGLETLSDVQLSPADPIPAGSDAHFSITGTSGDPPFLIPKFLIPPR